jgi:hypothetical protein
MKREKRKEKREKRKEKREKRKEKREKRKIATNFNRDIKINLNCGGFQSAV